MSFNGCFPLSMKEYQGKWVTHHYDFRHQITDLKERTLGSRKYTSIWEVSKEGNTNKSSVDLSSVFLVA